MPSSLLAISAVLWAGTLILGAGDGLYYHLLKLRLFARPDSRAEHVVHSLRALLLLPTLWLALVAPSSALPASTRILALLALIAGDWLLAATDVVLERKSRVHLGGLPHPEYFIHVAVTAQHAAAEAFALAGWIVATGSSPPRFVAVLGSAMIATGTVVLAAHILVLHPRFARFGPER